MVGILSVISVISFFTFKLIFEIIYSALILPCVSIDNPAPPPLGTQVSTFRQVSLFSSCCLIHYPKSLVLRKLELVMKVRALMCKCSEIEMKIIQINQQDSRPLSQPAMMISSQPILLSPACTTFLLFPRKSRYHIHFISAANTTTIFLL